MKTPPIKVHPIQRLRALGLPEEYLDAFADLPRTFQNEVERILDIYVPLHPVPLKPDTSESFGIIPRSERLSGELAGYLEDEDDRQLDIEDYIDGHGEQGFHS